MTKPKLTPMGEVGSGSNKYLTNNINWRQLLQMIGSEKFAIKVVPMMFLVSRFVLDLHPTVLRGEHAIENLIGLSLSLCSKVIP